ncbi:hypothetical protein, partial [Leisingera sp. ANG-S3]|uniref:hypothetical protein n=1 Tax=Leisingera sp. ANG-S3 TaxID=1577899 RepID=UPI0019D71030
ICQKQQAFAAVSLPCPALRHVVPPRLYYRPVYVSVVDIPRVKMYRIAALAQDCVRFGLNLRNK